MSKVFLKKLIIENFKGVKSLDINFENKTIIEGDNALGKTTIFDAFCWLMFDKDSKNRAKFEIKPLDKNNEVIKGLNPTVTGVLLIDNLEIKLIKTLKEKWTKKRGDAEKTFNSNETIYEIDDVPVKKSEYVKKISEIAEEEQFRLLTNPYYFSEVLNWKDARRIILEVAGNVSIQQVIDSNRELESLKIHLGNNDVDALLNQKKASIKKLSDEKKEIKPRIDECSRNIKEDIDLVDVENELLKCDEELNYIEECIKHIDNDSKKVMEKQAEIFNKKKQLQDIEHAAINRSYKEKDKLTLQEREILNKQYKEETLLNDTKREIDKLIYDKEQKSKKLTQLRENWTNKNMEEVNLSDIETTCPTCKRDFDIEQIEETKYEIIENFNKQKSKILTDLQQQGTLLKKEIEEIEKEIEALKSKSQEITNELVNISKEHEEIKLKINSLEVKVINTEEEKLKIKALNKEIFELENMKENDNKDELKELSDRKDNIKSRIEELNRARAEQIFINSQKDRKKELLEKERSLGVEIASQERIVMLCEEFIKTRVSLLESNINNKFKSVKFRLFKFLVNGGIEECCDPLIDGVPFSNANTASQINAGLDIIKTLNEHFKTSMPVFIDNAESVNNLIDIDSQIVEMRVTKDKELIIRGEM